MDELRDLQVFFQQRHLLSHKEGIVDAEYTNKSKDLTYSVGQRLVTKDSAVIRLADLVEKLGGGIKTL